MGGYPADRPLRAENGGGRRRIEADIRLVPLPLRQVPRQKNRLEFLTNCAEVCAVLSDCHFGSLPAGLLGTGQFLSTEIWTPLHKGPTPFDQIARRRVGPRGGRGAGPVGSVP